MTGGPMDDINARIAKLEALVAEYDHPAVAFSGGSDSCFLLSFIRIHMNKKVLALIADSPFLSRSDYNDAISFCRAFDIEFQIVGYDPLSHSDVAMNGNDRCYFCKELMFRALMDAADSDGCDVVFDGSVTDDLGDDRPGMRALEELGIKSPLLEADISKADIPIIADQLNLTLLVKPSTTCLATRIPEGQKIDLQHLQMAETAERILRDVGVDDIRIRVHESNGSLIARIEVPIERLHFFTDEENRDATTKVLRMLGFDFITLDLDGYRAGGRAL